MRGASAADDGTVVLGLLGVVVPADVVLRVGGDVLDTVVAAVAGGLGGGVGLDGDTVEDFVGEVAEGSLNVGSDFVVDRGG